MVVRELGDGIDGEDVRALQTVLHELGYTEVGTPDARFGNDTIAAVIRFQSEHGLTSTGVVDDVTRLTIIATATTYGLAHLGSDLIDDADAFAHGVAPHHTGVHDVTPTHDAGAHVPEGATRSEDGNYWWDGAAWQLVHADGAASAHGGPSHKDDYEALIQGFTDLTVAAVQNDGRTLDTVHFGGHLGAAHHTLLEHVRATLIDAQGDEAARERAAHGWAALEAQLQTAAGEARHAGVPEDSVLVFTENLAVVGEGYVHARHKGAAHMESPEDYVDLMTGVQQLVLTVNKVWWDRSDGVVPTNIAETDAAQQTELHAVTFGSHLTPDHHELLEHLRHAFLLARTQGSARAALTQWQSVQPALHHALTRAATFVHADLSWLSPMIAEMDDKLFHQGVVAEAEHRAHAHSTLETPDLPLQIKRLEEAAEGLSEVDELVKKSEQLTTESAVALFLAKGSVKPDLAHAIMEIAQNPHEIYEKFEEFQKAGRIEQSVTVLQMADKVLAVRNGVMEVALETVQGFAKKRAEEFAAQGLTDVAKNWAETAEWAEDRLEVLEKVKTAATVITIAVGAIKVIDAIRRGEWGEALKEAASTGFGLAVGAAAGTAGTVVLAGVTVMVAAEMEGISGAAAMIRWARETNEREAALGFVEICADALTLEAQGLVEDVEALKDPANAEEKQRIEAKLDSNAKYWRRDLHRLSELYLDDRVISIGGQPELRAALGDDAQRVLASPGDGAELTGLASWENMARQIHVVFAGANRMTKFFVDKNAKK